MGVKADSRRRWLGAIFLGLAAAMLVAGQTVLENRLSTAGFILFWTACFFSTFLAIVIALLDALIVRTRNRSAQRELLHQTVDEIAREKQRRSHKSSVPSNGAS